MLDEAGPAVREEILGRVSWRSERRRCWFSFSALSPNFLQLSQRKQGQIHFLSSVLAEPGWGRQAVSLGAGCVKGMGPGWVLIPVLHQLSLQCAES